MKSKRKEKSKTFEAPGWALENNSHVFRAEWDDEGVYFYQAFRDEIADWALENQELGGPLWRKERMTWIKPSFAWMLYRSGYGTKSGQERILKIKLSHDTVAAILEQCIGADAKTTDAVSGRVQWDPSRDIMRGQSDKKFGVLPSRIPNQRAIQIGLRGELSTFYAQNAVFIEDVTELAYRCRVAHLSRISSESGSESGSESESEMKVLAHRLPIERPYMPAISDEDLRKIGM